MGWKAPDLSLLDTINEQLKPLYKKSQDLQKEIGALCDKRKELHEKLDKACIATIPKNMKKWAREQWVWVLETGDGESVPHYRFRDRLITSLGLNASGFYPDTNQPCVTMHPYGFDKDKILNGLKTLLPHLKPQTVVDVRHGTTEIGVRIALSGLDENVTSVFYIHKDGTVSLYRNTYSKPEQFKSVEDMLSWYGEHNSESV